MTGISADFGPFSRLGFSVSTYGDATFGTPIDGSGASPSAPPTVIDITASLTYTTTTSAGGAATSGTAPIDGLSPYSDNGLLPFPSAEATALGNTGALTLDGHSFVGWCTTADAANPTLCTGTQYAPGASIPVIANTVLRSVWAVAYAADGSGTLTTPTTSVITSTTGNTLVLTYTAATNGMNNGALHVTVPAGWSAPSAAAGAGCTTASSGTLAFAGQTIQVTGVTLATAGTLTLTYGATSGGLCTAGSGATAQPGAGTAVFSTVHKTTAAGTLTALGASPSVTVANGPQFTVNFPAGGLPAGLDTFLTTTGLVGSQKLTGCERSGAPGPFCTIVGTSIRLIASASPETWTLYVTAVDPSSGRTTSVSVKYTVRAAVTGDYVRGDTSTNDVPAGQDTAVAFTGVELRSRLECLSLPGTPFRSFSGISKETTIAPGVRVYCHNYRPLAVDTFKVWSRPYLSFAVDATAKPGTYSVAVPLVNARGSFTISTTVVASSATPPATDPVGGLTSPTADLRCGTSTSSSATYLWLVNGRTLPESASSKRTLPAASVPANAVISCVVSDVDAATGMVVSKSFQAMVDGKVRVGVTTSLPVLRARAKTKRIQVRVSASGTKLLRIRTYRKIVTGSGTKARVTYKLAGTKTVTAKRGTRSFIVTAPSAVGYQIDVTALNRVKAKNGTFKLRAGRQLLLWL